jgi:hypothetical protein
MSAAKKPVDIEILVAGVYFPGWGAAPPSVPKAEFPDYDSGSDGPKAANELLARDGDRAWRPVSPASEQKP